MAVGEEAEVADAVEAGRQDMKQEPAHELAGVERHDLLAPVPVVLPAEADLAVGHAEEPAVGDGDAVGVAPEIGEDLLGPAERALGVDHPVDPAQQGAVGGEGVGLGQRREVSGEAQPACGEGAGEALEEQSPEQPAEDLHRQEEAGRAADPPRPVRREAAGGHDAVDVRVVLHRLPPAVQHGDAADLGTEMARVGRDDAQRLGGGAEQDGVDRRLVLEGDRADRGRQGEDHVEVGDRQQLGAPCRDPGRPRVALALGTVAVAARVVGDLGMAAIGAAA